MEFEYIEYLIGILAGILISYIGALMTRWSSRLENTVEIVCALAAIGLFIWSFGFSSILIMAGLSAHSYGMFHLIFPNKRKLEKFKKDHARMEFIPIPIKRSFSRIFADLFIVGILTLLSILFILFGPETSFVMKLVLLLGMVTAISGVVNRVWKFYTLKIFFHPKGNQLYIQTKNEPKKYPLESLKELRSESGVDLLRLNSMFSLFTSSVDYTTRFDRVLRLVFPGEIIYLTVDETDKWYAYFKGFVTEKAEEDKVITSFFDGKTIKRLLGKSYFAISVKGISAYTTLFLILYWLETPYWVVTVAVIAYWVFNLWISDKVLKIAMDAEEITDSNLLNCAERVFSRAGIKNTKLYKTEAAEYNALATGLNVGRAMVTLTTETLKLDLKHIEAIIAHEAVHVKKRDVLLTQAGRLLYLGLLVAITFSFIGLIESQGDGITWILVGAIWLLMMGFAVYLSVLSQFTEVRADHLGATLIDGTNQQMAQALTELSIKQDASLVQASSYQLAGRNTAEDQKRIDSLERRGWFWRILEFQFLPHPPMYWRVKSLKTNDHGWGRGILKVWWKDRLKDSIPDLKKKKHVSEQNKNM